MKYDVCMALMQFLYSGLVFEQDEEIDSDKFELLIELILLSDQYMLDSLKSYCCGMLQLLVNEETVDFLLSQAIQSHSIQLKRVCHHFKRNRTHSKNEQDPTETPDCGSLIIGQSQESE